MSVRFSLNGSESESAKTAKEVSCQPHRPLGPNLSAGLGHMAAHRKYNGRYSYHRGRAQRAATIQHRAFIIYRSTSRGGVCWWARPAGIRYYASAAQIAFGPSRNIAKTKTHHTAIAATQTLRCRTICTNVVEGGWSSSYACHNCTNVEAPAMKKHTTTPRMVQSTIFDDWWKSLW